MTRSDGPGISKSFGGDVQGAAVHEAARIAADAPAGEVLVSSTTQLSASGARFDFDYEGERQFKGISAPRQVYTVSKARGAPGDDRSQSGPEPDLLDVTDAVDLPAGSMSSDDDQ